MGNRIQLTSGIVTQSLIQLFNSSTSQNAFGSGATISTRLYVYKGVMPTDAEISALSGSSFISLRANDLLIDLDCRNLYDSLSGNTAKLKTSAYGSAARSGVATFFIMFTNSNNNTSPAINKAIVGKITNASGDGDLKLATTSIVAGRAYRVQPLSFSVPYQYSY